MKVGDKVQVRYTDAIKKQILWDGVIKAALPDGAWQVDLGGIAIVVQPQDIIEVPQ